MGALQNATTFTVVEFLLPNISQNFHIGGAYRKASNKRLASNESRPLIDAGCTGTLNLKNASNYIPLINACLQ